MKKIHFFDRILNKYEYRQVNLLTNHIKCSKCQKNILNNFTFNKKYYIRDKKSTFYCANCFFVSSSNISFNLALSSLLK